MGCVASNTPPSCNTHTHSLRCPERRENLGIKPWILIHENLDILHTHTHTHTHTYKQTWLYAAVLRLRTQAGMCVCACGVRACVCVSVDTNSVFCPSRAPVAALRGAVSCCITTTMAPYGEQKDLAFSACDKRRAGHYAPQRSL